MPGNPSAIAQIEASISEWRNWLSDLAGGRDIARWQGWAMQRYAPALYADQRLGTSVLGGNEQVVASWPCLIHHDVSAPPMRPGGPAAASGSAASARSVVPSNALGNWRGALMVLTDRRLLISQETPDGTCQVMTIDRAALVCVGPCSFKAAWGDGPPNDGYELTLRDSSGAQAKVQFRLVMAPTTGTLANLLERAGVPLSAPASDLSSWTSGTGPVITPATAAMALEKPNIPAEPEVPATPGVPAPTTKQCPACAKVTRLEAKFCGSCGMAFQGSVQQATETVSALPPPPSAPTVPAGIPNTTIADFPAQQAEPVSWASLDEALPPGEAESTSTLLAPASNQMHATVLADPQPPVTATWPPAAGQFNTVGASLPPVAAATRAPLPPAARTNPVARENPALIAKAGHNHALIAVVLALLLISVAGLGSVIYLLTQGALALPGHVPTPTTVAAPTRVVPSSSVPRSTPTPTRRPTPTPTPNLDPRAKALGLLNDARDESLDGLQLDGRWILQVGSKYEGVTDPRETTASGSHTFLLPDIWTTHENLASALSSQGDVLLLQATDFGRQVSLPDVTWVTILDPVDSPVWDYDSGQARCAELYPNLWGDDLANACMPRQLRPPFSG